MGSRKIEEARLGQQKLPKILFDGGAGTPLDHDEESRVAVRCKVCGSWVVANDSVRDRIGPKCRAKVDADG